MNEFRNRDSVTGPIPANSNRSNNLQHSDRNINIQLHNLDPRAFNQTQVPKKKILSPQNLRNPSPMTVLNAPNGQPKYLNSGAFNASSKMSEDIVWSDQLTSPTGAKNLLQQGSFRRTNLNQSQENWRARYQFDNQQALNKKIATRQAGKRKNFFNTPSDTMYEISRASGIVQNFDE